MLPGTVMVWPRRGRGFVACLSVVCRPLGWSRLRGDHSPLPLRPLLHSNGLTSPAPTWGPNAGGATYSCSQDFKATERRSRTVMVGVARTGRWLIALGGRLRPLDLSNGLRRRRHGVRTPAALRIRNGDTSSAPTGLSLPGYSKAGEAR